MRKTITIQTKTNLSGVRQMCAEQGIEKSDSTIQRWAETGLIATERVGLRTVVVPPQVIELPAIGRPRKLNTNQNQ